MLAKHFRDIFLLVSGLLLLSHACADEVRMRNGDVISGQIVKKETDKLIFRTSYAGELQIQWSEVLNLISDEPVHVVLSDGASIRGTLQESEVGEAKVQPPKEIQGKDFDLRETRYINPSPDLTGEGVRWTGNINAGGTMTRGNNETEALRFDAETIARTLKNRYTIGGIFNRAEDRGNNTQFNSRGYGKVDRFFSPQWYAYANATLENDRFRDLRLRSTTGIGSGYQVFETPDLNLSLEGGVNYIKQDYYDETDESYPGVRWATKFDQMLFSGTTKLFHEHEVLMGLQTNNQTLVYSKTGLRFPLFFNFNASTQLNYNWDSRPAAGRKRDDATLLFTLGYGW